MNLYDVYSLYNVELVKGSGPMVYDRNGVGYLDFYGGHAVISVGHSHPHYVSMIQKQLHQIGFYSNLVQNSLQVELAEKLGRASGLEGYDLFLINSGAEANENALKLASFYNDRKKVIALENSFHGRTSAAINVTHTGQKHASSINGGIDVSYFNKEDVEGILKAINSEEYSAIIVEAIQGVGGLDMISEEVTKQIELACHETKTALIMDEVQCGYGRSGRFFAFQHLGIKPDIITTAKGMGNGFPIGGVLINSDKMPPVKSRLGTTYGGNHLACAAGIAVLDIITAEDLIEHSRRMGEILALEMKEVAGVKHVKGRGLMIGVEFDYPVAELRKKLIFDHHVFTGSSANKNLLRTLPPLNITDRHIDQFISRPHGRRRGCVGSANRRK